MSLAHIGDNWETPPEVYAKFGDPYHLTLDVCAEASSAKCPTFFSPESNGLKQEWSGRIWMNPPYSNIQAWVAKAFRSRNQCELIVCLLPAKTDTRWFHSFVYRKARVQFLRGRISFLFDGNQYERASFPSMVAIYRPDRNTYQSIHQTRLELFK